MKYAGLIRATRDIPTNNYQDAAASGVWSIKDAVQLHGSDKFPIAGNFLSDGRNNTTTAWMGYGFDNNRNNEIDQKSFDSNADATSWADFSYNASARQRGTVTNYTIGIVGGGFYCCGPSDIATINKITFSTQADATAYGELSGGRVHPSCHMSATKGFWNGGRANSYSDDIEEKDMSSSGNTSDHGTLGTTVYESGAMGTPTKMIVCKISQSSAVDTIHSVDLTSASDSVDFGDLLATTDAVYCAGNDTVGIVRDIHDDGNRTAADKITFATNSDAVDHGDSNGQDSLGMVGDDVRVMIYGGIPSGYTDVIETMTYASGGTASDYGDLTSAHAGDGGQSHN